MALTTTTTSSPWRRVRATWSATARMRSASPTEVPPNFWTTSAIVTTLPLVTRRLRSARSEPLGHRHGRVGCRAMPSEKRARQRAAREAKQAALQRQQKRRSTVRRTITAGRPRGRGGRDLRPRRSASSPKPTAATPRRPPRPSTARSTTTSTAGTATTTTLATAQATADAARRGRRLSRRPHDHAHEAEPTRPAPAMPSTRPRPTRPRSRPTSAPSPSPSTPRRRRSTVNNFVFLAQYQLLRLRQLPPGHPRLRRPGRRPHRDRHRRTRLQVRRDRPGLATNPPCSTRSARWPWPTRTARHHDANDQRQPVLRRRRRPAASRSRPTTPVRSGHLGHDRRQTRSRPTAAPRARRPRSSTACSRSPSPTSYALLRHRHRLTDHLPLRGAP